MLLLIIGLALVTTMMVTGAVSEQEQRQQVAHAIAGHNISRSDAQSPVIVASEPIASGTTITKRMIEQVRMPEKAIWQDAITTTPNAVNRTAQHDIPAYAQIREADLK